MHCWDVCYKNISKVPAAGHASSITAANDGNAFLVNARGHYVPNKEVENGFGHHQISLSGIFQKQYPRSEYWQNASTRDETMLNRWFTVASFDMLPLIGIRRPHLFP